MPAQRVERLLASRRRRVVFALSSASACALASLPALADTVVAVPTSITLAGIAVAAVVPITTILGSVAIALVNKYVKDAAAAKLIDGAIASSVGTIQQVAQGAIKTVDPSLAIPARYAAYAPGVQYVVDHAGDELTRLGVTPEAVAERIEAKIGVLNIAHNIAVAGNSSPPEPPPLSPVPTPGV